MNSEPARHPSHANESPLASHSELAAPRFRRVFFDRRELAAILNVYGRMVAAGYWRDYAIDGREEMAVFAVFRHASDIPHYRVEKRPELARRQGVWSVVGRGGVILRRGHDLPKVLRVFDRARFRLVD